MSPYSIAMRLLKIHPKILQRLARTGKVAAIQIGTRVASGIYSLKRQTTSAIPTISRRSFVVTNGSNGQSPLNHLLMDSLEVQRRIAASTLAPRWGRMYRRQHAFVVLAGLPSHSGFHCRLDPSVKILIECDL